MLERIFYYKSEQLIKEIPMQKAPAADWLNFLQKRIKIEEERDLGLLDFLAHKKNRIVDKEDILRYIDKNRLVIDEKILSGKEIDPQRAEYTTKGLRNYREIVISIPDTEPYHTDKRHFSESGKEICWCRCADAKIRGRKILVIDEMQSNRHQSGHLEGYRPQQLTSWSADRWRSILFDNSGLSVEEKVEKLMQYVENYVELKILIQNMPPEAPLKEWWKFIVKRMLHYATLNGYDEIAIVDGKTQLQRYGLDEDSKLGDLYDKIIIGFIRKYMKKWDIVPYNRAGAWHIVLAKEFKKDIIQNGQPLYRLKDRKVDETVKLEDIKDICDKFKIELLSNKIVREPNLLGWYTSIYDTCYVIYDNHNSVDELKKTIIHESLAHRGLQKTLGRRYNYFLNQVWINVMTQDNQNEYIKKYKNMFTATAEFVADAFEKNSYESNVIQRICSLIKLCLIKIGLDCSINLVDIYNLASYSIRKHGLIETHYKNHLSL